MPKVNMLGTTREIIRAALKADPTLSVAERSRILAIVQNYTNPSKNDAAAGSESRLVRRAEAARRLGCSLRLVDKLAKDGILPKRRLPSRQRAAGFLERDLNALIAGKTT